MIKNFALMTLAAIALTGCNGSSSKSKVKPEARIDYPIIDAQFSPNSTEVFNYSQMVNGVTQDDLSVRFEKHSGDSLLQLILDQEEDNSPLINLLNSLINSGTNEFFLKEVKQKENEPSIFYVASDGNLREITDFYIDLYAEKPNFAKPLMFNYSKTWQTNGNKIIQHGISGSHSNPNRMVFDLSGYLAKSLLNDFSDDLWLRALSDQSVCKITWLQSRVESAERKTVTVSAKRVEAAPISDKRSYQLNCDGQESPRFEVLSELWYNPTLGVLEQSQRLSVNQQNPVTTTIWLDSLPL